MVVSQQRFPAKSLPVSLCAILMGVTSIWLSITQAHAAGHWKWRDDKGIVVYSDLPPPPSVKDGQILTREKNAPAPSQPENTPPPAAPPQTPEGNPATKDGQKAPPPADSDIQARLRERQEAEKKEKEEQTKKAELARACEQARANLRSLESGLRISTVGEKGEVSVIDDAERKKRTEQAQLDITRACLGH